MSGRRGFWAGHDKPGRKRVEITGKQTDVDNGWHVQIYSAIWSSKQRSGLVVKWIWQHTNRVADPLLHLSSSRCFFFINNVVVYWTSCRWSAAATFYRRQYEEDNGNDSMGGDVPGKPKTAISSRCTLCSSRAPSVLVGSEALRRGWATSQLWREDGGKQHGLWKILLLGLIVRNFVFLEFFSCYGDFL